MWRALEQAEREQALIDLALAHPEELFLVTQAYHRDGIDIVHDPRCRTLRYHRYRQGAWVRGIDKGRDGPSPAMPLMMRLDELDLQTCRPCYICWPALPKPPRRQPLRSTTASALSPQHLGHTAADPDRRLLGVIRRVTQAYSAKGSVTTLVTDRGVFEFDGSAPLTIMQHGLNEVLERSYHSTFTA